MMIKLGKEIERLCLFFCLRICFVILRKTNVKRKPRKDELLFFLRSQYPIHDRIKLGFRDIISLTLIHIAVSTIEFCFAP